jgi:hypothetical protein
MVIVTGMMIGTTLLAYSSNEKSSLSPTFTPSLAPPPGAGGGVFMDVERWLVLGPTPSDFGSISRK